MCVMQTAIESIGAVVDDFFDKQGSSRWLLKLLIAKWGISNLIKKKHIKDLGEE